MRRPGWRHLSLVVAATVVMSSATPSDASAQFGWVKKVLGKGDKKKPAAAPPAAAQPAAQPSAPGAPTVASPVAPAAQPGVFPPAPGQAAADAAALQAAQQQAQQAAERDSMVAEGRRLDAEIPQTLRTAKYRADYWEGLRLSGVSNVEVNNRYRAAVRDFDSLRTVDSTLRANEAAAKAVNAKLEQATRALNNRDLAGAESSVDEILAGDPTNQRAQNLKENIVRARRAKQFMTTLLVLAAAAIALAVFIGVFAKKIFKRGDGAAAGTAPPVAGGRKVLVKVVDGIGRGKLLPINGDVFRIGAAASDKPEEHNDLVISDAGAVVSRFHCSIIRRGKDFYIVDSSLNGTALNDKPLERGEHRKLRDGDDVTIADVARLKFLAT